MATPADIIRNLEARKIELSEQIKILITTFNGLKSSAGMIDVKIVKLQDEVRALEATVADMQRKIADIKAKYGL